MDYFSLFGLPVQLDVEQKELRAKYLELSRRTHPDYFATSGAAAQEDALQATAELNKAFKTLSNREETIRYVLEQKGLIEQDEKYKLSPDFLMEMLEINEAIAELAFEKDPAQEAAVRNQIKQIENDMYTPVAAIVESYAEGITTKEELLQVKDYYFRKKYLERLEQQLRGML
jgi:molecular chaperone HscB